MMILSKKGYCNSKSEKKLQKTAHLKKSRLIRKTIFATLLENSLIDPLGGDEVLRGNNAFFTWKRAKGCIIYVCF